MLDCDTKPNTFVNAFSMVSDIELDFTSNHFQFPYFLGHKESPLMPLKESLILAEINDEIRRQIDVRFPQDDI